MAHFPESLPHSEWDFSEIDGEDPNRAFLYEYARDSDRIKSQVNLLREMDGFWSPSMRERDIECFVMSPLPSPLSYRPG